MKTLLVEFKFSDNWEAYIPNDEEKLKSLIVRDHDGVEMRIIKDEHPIESARFTHDCDVCEYLGRHEEYDLYFCKEAPTVVARFSSAGADYTSGMAFATPGGSKPLYEAKKLAIKQGLFNDN